MSRARTRASGAGPSLAAHAVRPRDPQPRSSRHARNGLGSVRGAKGVGKSFAWTIGTPLTAAFIGAGYAAGAALGVALALRDGIWQRVRIVVVSALTLLVTNLITTVHFWSEFKFGQGDALERLIAWSWLTVYVSFPPLVVLLIIVQERRSGRAEWRVTEPLTAFTRAAFGATAVALIGLGIWLMITPDALAERWPWKLPDLPASILGTWFLTLATSFGWALVERDWKRVRIVIAPLAASILLHLIAAARLADTFTGSDGSIAVYLGALAAGLAAVGGAWYSQRAHTRFR